MKGVRDMGAICFRWGRGVRAVGVILLLFWQCLGVEGVVSAAPSVGPKAAPSRGAQKPSPVGGKPAALEYFEHKALNSKRAPGLYEALKRYCIDEHSRNPVGVVWQLNVEGRPFHPAWSPGAMRQRVDPKTLEVDRQPVAAGMKLCEGDLLLTWQGISLVVQYFRVKQEANKEPADVTFAARAELKPLARLKLGVRRNTLVEGRLGYFADPDLKDQQLVLGRDVIMTSFGTYAELEVTDTCESRGSVTIPKQAPGAEGEVHQGLLCTRSEAEGLSCDPLPVTEGQQVLFEGTERPPVPEQVRQEALEQATQGYQAAVGQAERDRVPLPKKDGDAEPSPEPARLELTVVPASAQVWLNGEPVRVIDGKVTHAPAPGPLTVLVRSGKGKKQETRILAPAEPWILRMEVEAMTPVGPPKQEWPEYVPEFLPVPGTGPDGFWMGSKEGEGNDNERPRHTVVIQPFQLSKTEVTVAQYKACVDAGQCKKPNTGGDCNWEVASREQHPINCVDWNQAQAYATWLSTVVGGTVRLPSEAEWEYAATGGGKTTYSGTSVLTDVCTYGNVADQTAKEKNPDWSIVECRDGYAEVAPVGRYESGAWGLKDMTGNVWEWVDDCWHDSYKNAPQDGSPWTTSCYDSALRVFRGGSWGDDPDWLRGADRFGSRAGNRGWNRGFRVVLASVPGGEH